MKCYEKFISKVEFKVLSDMENINLFLRMKSGDMSAREVLIKGNSGLVIYQIMNKFKKVDCDKKELISYAAAGLIKAVDSYNDLKKIKFSAYAVSCIDKEILSFLRRVGKYSKTNALYSENANNNKYVMQVDTNKFIYNKKDFTKVFDRGETSLVIRKIINNLSFFEREIIMLYFGFDGEKYSQVDIAEKFNLSKATVSRMVRCIVKKISYQLDEEGVIELKDEAKNEGYREILKEKTVASKTLSLKNKK